MTIPVYSHLPVPGRLRIMGEENRNQAWTRLVFMDKSVVLVHWDGRHEVAGIPGEGTVTIYCPNGVRLYFSRHTIRMIEHQERQEERP